MARKFRAPGRSVLFLIALFLLASAAIRFGDGAGQAIAKEIRDLAEAEEPAPPLHCEPSPDIAALLSALGEREARIDAAELAITDRLQALNVAEREIEKNLSLLIEAEERLAATIATSDTAAEDDLSRLTAVYENMKPQDAALLFETMEPEFAAGFLGRMKPGSAAAVMAGLPPASAYAISVLLAGRNALAPTE